MAGFSVFFSIMSWISAVIKSFFPSRPVSFGIIYFADIIQASLSASQFEIHLYYLYLFTLSMYFCFSLGWLRIFFNFRSFTLRLHIKGRWADPHLGWYCRASLHFWNFCCCLYNQYGFYFLFLDSSMSIFVSFAYDIPVYLICKTNICVWSSV